jgi:hydrogenase expression/formation protein HypD
MSAAAKTLDPSLPFRDPVAGRRVLDEIRAMAGALDEPVRFMEVCGTHTMSAARAGLHALLPASVRLSSGPGCPVCVTAPGYIAAACALARSGEATITTFGDMIRVPGGGTSLETERANGADVRVVYSPLDALALARRDLTRAVVFLGVGFETTTPAIGAAIRTAWKEGLANFSVLGAQKTMPGPMRAVCESGEIRIDGFLCPGHVSTIIGAGPYRFLADEFGIPCAVAGFEPLEILLAVRELLRMHLGHRPSVMNLYGRAVREQGNPEARAIMADIYEPSDAEWRGLGTLPESGLSIRRLFKDHDARRVFAVEEPILPPPPGCLCGAILRGAAEPRTCGLFGAACTPDRPVGPCMVSSEGACAAAWKYRDTNSTPQARKRRGLAGATATGAPS